MVSINEQKGGRGYLHKIKKEKRRGWNFPGGCGSMGGNFYLSKCHFDGANLHGFSIRMRSIFS